MMSSKLCASQQWLRSKVNFNTSREITDRKKPKYNSVSVNTHNFVVVIFLFFNQTLEPLTIATNCPIWLEVMCQGTVHHYFTTCQKLFFHLSLSSLWEVTFFLWKISSVPAAADHWEGFHCATKPCFGGHFVSVDSVGSHFGTFLYLTVEDGCPTAF